MTKLFKLREDVCQINEMYKKTWLNVKVTTNKRKGKQNNTK